MFKRILVPLDGSGAAVSAMTIGARLATRWGADLTILTLLRRGDRLLTVDKIVSRQIERLSTPRRVEMRTLSYSVADDIAEEFDEVDGTLVVMGTEARGRVAGLVGNIAEDVFRKTRRPMVLVGPNVDVPDRWPCGSLMVCTDGGDFADSVADDAVAMAAALDLATTVIAVVDPDRVPAGAPISLESNAGARLANELEPVVGGPVGFETLHGADPAAVISEHAEHRGAGLIALATHGRAGLDRLANGSVAMDVVRTARCPVLISRPVSAEGKH